MDKYLRDGRPNATALQPTLFWLLLTGTAGCGLVALYASGPVLPLVATCFAVVLLVAALLFQMRNHIALMRGTANRGPMTTPQEAIIALLTHDADVAYLTDSDGDILYANPVAQERFGDISDGHLASAFSRILANPEAVLFRLQNRAAATGAAR